MEEGETALHEFRLRGAEALYQAKDSGHMISIADRSRESDSWVVTLTQNRLLIWSPLTPGGLLGTGSMKAKPGKATGGQLRYIWVDDIIRDSQLTLAFQVYSDPDDWVTSMMFLLLSFVDADQAHDFAVALADLLDSFHRQRGIDSADLVAELGKLKNLDWSVDGEMKLSLLRAGAKVKYPPR